MLMPQSVEVVSGAVAEALIYSKKFIQRSEVLAMTLAGPHGHASFPSFGQACEP